MCIRDRNEAALVLKAMDLSESDEIEMMRKVNDEIARTKIQSGGTE